MARFQVHTRPLMNRFRSLMHVRPIAIRLLASCALIVGAAGCQNEQTATSAKAAGATPPPLAVTVVRVDLQSVPIVLEAVGQAEGSREVEIRARVAGVLEKRLYTEGAAVKAGQTLFLIDRAPYEIAVAQARAALSQERVRLELAQREAERLKSLAGSRAISQREYDEAVAAAKQSGAAIEGAQANLAQAELNLSYTNVKATIGGITSRAVRSEGSLVSANTDLLTSITQVDPLWIGFSLAEADFERIRGAQRQAKVSLLNQDGSVAAQGGRLNFTGSSVDPKLGTVRLRAEFPNGALKWLPGQFVRVHIIAGEQQAFLVPQAAVVQTEQARLVWVVSADGSAVQKPIQTANWIGNQWVVTGGLQAGDAIIVDNLIKLRPGAKIEPRTAAASTPAAEAQPPAASATGSSQPKQR
jgi:membrane fusion protein, multidrug efflux system